MIIHDNFIFVHLQKTGGTFVEKFLWKTFGQDNVERIQPQHRGITTVIDKIGDRITFGVIRNPWDWYVSWWASRKTVSDSLFHKIFTTENRQNFGKFLRFVLNGNFGKQHDLDAKIMLDKDIGIYTYRYRKCFCDKDGNNLLDRVLRTENLREDLESFLTDLSIELPDDKKEYLYSMHKRNASSHKSYKEYYTDDLVELVRHKDRLIVERYGYDYEIYN